MRPANVPSRRNKVYTHDRWEGCGRCDGREECEGCERCKGWGHGHWLGTGNQRFKQFLPFDEALAVARSLGLSNTTECKAWRARPTNAPSNPANVYMHGGWQVRGHWMGTDSSKTSNRQLVARHLLRSVDGDRVAFRS